MMRVLLQPAFVLHERRYHESSVLLEVFSQDYGRVGMVARGVKKRHSLLKGVLQPFQPLLLSWSGKGELMSLKTAERDNTDVMLGSFTMLCALYMNEILLRVLVRFDAYPGLFAIYRWTLLQFHQLDNATDRAGFNRVSQQLLRCFEKQLLSELGYALLLTHEAQTHVPIVAEARYCYRDYQGPVPVSSDKRQDCISGHSLLAFAQDQLEDEQVLQDAKRVTRISMRPLIGSKPLKTRELFRGLKK